MDHILSSLKGYYTGVSTGKTKATVPLAGFKTLSYIYGINLDLFSFMKLF